MITCNDPSGIVHNNNVDSSSPQLPRVVACGYKHFISYKSGQTFPAVLVQFGPDDFYWRTKKDFLLLKRQSNSTISFPKKAYAKLISRSPWIRNLSHDDDILREKMSVESGNQEQNSTTLINNYDTDMKKSLYWVDDFLFKTTRSNTINAMSEFHRREDASHLTVFHNQTNTYESIHSSSISHQQNASAIFGQYFASPENVDVVIKTILNYITEIETGQTSSTREAKEMVLLCEPSCGDGRMIQSFFNTFRKHHGNSQKQYDHSSDGKLPLVIGYDIDHNTIQQAHNRLSDYKNNVLLKCTDALLEPSFPRNTNDTNLVVFGSPPYTTGAGSGDKIKRDLPEKFVHHFIKNWKADFIAFILPERYRSFNWDDVTVENSHADSTTRSGYRYSSETIQLVNSTFHENISEGEGKCNMRQIQQPSVLILLKRQSFQNETRTL